jgi:hypothetical protein
VNPDRPGEQDHRLRLAEARGRLHDAALEAERATGRHEESIEQAERGLVLRAVRAVAGFALVGVGIALLLLPGPGWVMIIIGLSLLPFTWAERTIRSIRRRIPGVPQDGAIPVSTWIVMGLILAAIAVVSILFGKQMGHWMSGAWSDLWS